jgi:hypothetical protein
MAVNSFEFIKRKSLILIPIIIIIFPSLSFGDEPTGNIIIDGNPADWAGIQPVFICQQRSTMQEGSLEPIFR